MVPFTGMGIGLGVVRNLELCFGLTFEICVRCANQFQVGGCVYGLRPWASHIWSCAFGSYQMSRRI